MSVCLDSWAVLAWLHGQEPALTRVADVIEARPVISWINLVECTTGLSVTTAEAEPMKI